MPVPGIPTEWRTPLFPIVVFIPRTPPAAPFPARKPKNASRGRHGAPETDTGMN